MNNYPKFIEVKNKRYPINTDFRVVLEIDDLWRDETIGDYEKILATIYKLFGEEALDDTDNQEEIFDLAIKYIRCGVEEENLNNEEEPSMDFKQDQGYIKASFMSDYQIDLDKTNIHWWAFNDLLKGLTEDCVMNRVRYIREEDLSGKKGKELQTWKKMKMQVALKKEKTAREKELDKVFEEKMRKE